jgi:biotin operon repressor
VSERTLSDRVLGRLCAFHAGQAHGVRCKALADALGASERDLRVAITALREAGHPICGHPASGYFYARTPDELRETCDFLRNRALTSLRLEARLRRVPLGELVGQLSLDLLSARDETPARRQG